MILVLEKALNILEVLSRDTGKEYPLWMIANTLGMDRSTCANILKTLLQRGYVQQSAPRGGYKLGYMAYNLVNSSVNNEELTKVARGDVASLSKDLNESAILSVIRNDKRIVLLQVEPDRELYIKTNPAKSIYATNTGRVILANYTPAHLEKVIIRNGPPSAEEWPEVHDSPNPSGTLMNLLTGIRQAGYEIYEDANGIVGVAAPLFRDGHVLGSIGVYLPASRMENRQIIVNKVLERAKQINDKLALYSH